ncbi:hypothetical protein FRC08_009470 [Ceratobasidium sp. 394]|nr:hypothetical protein FRC08_009470 [Ceratobasidium sp. 394]KAG9091542.1 hypothetical protein FS749_016464 [Ceratobasidium sp. UAMH 11750]
MLGRRVFHGQTLVTVHSKPRVSKLYARKLNDYVPCSRSPSHVAPTPSGSRRKSSASRGTLELHSPPVPAQNFTPDGAVRDSLDGIQQPPSNVSDDDKDREIQTMDPPPSSSPNLSLAPSPSPSRRRERDRRAVGDRTRHELESTSETEGISHLTVDELEVQIARLNPELEEREAHESVVAPKATLEEADVEMKPEVDKVTKKLNGQATSTHVREVWKSLTNARNTYDVGEPLFDDDKKPL